jgi:hypothetical protein
MANLLSRIGLPYNRNGSAPGAQTERPGWPWPVRVLLGGTFSSAGLFQRIDFADVTDPDCGIGVIGRFISCR